MIKTETVTAEVIGIELPDEPARGTVVVDRFGLAWQRRDGALSGAHWHPAGQIATILPSALDTAPMIWGQLLLRRGDLTIVYRPTREDAK